jgi:hypothetical protein
MAKGARNPQTEVLLRLIDEAYNRSAWHGPNLRSSLRGVTSAGAAWRPGPGRHNIWEIAVHAAYWKYAVRQRLVGGKRGSFGERGSNWFAGRAKPDEAAWRRDLRLLEQEHRQLRQAIAAIGAGRLRQARKRGKGRPLGDHVVGIAFHDVYHAGQIQLLKRLQRAAGAT